MVYLRELPVPLAEADPDFIDVFYNFANTYTEKSVLFAEVERRKEKENDADLTADTFREMGYSEEEIAEMDL